MIFGQIYKSLGPFVSPICAVAKVLLKLDGLRVFVLPDRLIGVMSNARHGILTFSKSIKFI